MAEKSEFAQDRFARMLQSHPALTREENHQLAQEFLSAQEKICDLLAVLLYPIQRVMDELKIGRVAYNRERAEISTTAESRKGKASLRFSGIAPSHGLEFETQWLRVESGEITLDEFTAWQRRFLRKFIYDVLESIAKHVIPPPAGETGE